MGDLHTNTANSELYYRSAFSFAAKSNVYMKYQFINVDMRWRQQAYFARRWSVNDWSNFFFIKIHTTNFFFKQCMTWHDTVIFVKCFNQHRVMQWLERPTFISNPILSILLSFFNHCMLSYHSKRVRCLGLTRSMICFMATPINTWRDCEGSWTGRAYVL